MERRASPIWAWAALATAVLAAPAAVGAPAAHDPAPASAAARSLVLPGWGQLAQGQRRGLAYGVLEAALWAFWADRRGDGADLRGAYRELAWEQGRIPAGERRDGPWAYYEALSKWARSGAFDGDAARPGLQPEEDPSTFNGSVWSLAKGIHFRGAAPSPGDASYEAALAWYRSRAYADGYLWDWTGREAALLEYRSLIRGSDERFRDATAALGAVLANHLLSACDAFLSARLPGTAEVRLIAPGAEPHAPLGLTLAWRPSK
ncbi:MAG: hypothetical protein FIA95_14005 [Gemmatimonadetes bacterium]|nr:hypothetical protein [Gemmatimonadota bacterium]